MKNFFTSMLGALTALIIFSVGCFILFLGFVAAMAAMGSAEKGIPRIEQGSYLVFDLSTNITDAPPRINLSIFGAANDTVQLRSVTHALRNAAVDDRIAGVFITGDISPVDFGSGYAALKEVREALEEVKAAGKPIHAYITHATTSSYYLASVANELAMDPYGVLLMPGLASQPVFFAGLLEKYGINVQVTRVGKYKSAVEPFTRQQMSPENREEVQKLLGDIWGDLLSDISPHRNLTPAQIQATVDANGLLQAETARESGLIDRIAYRDEIYDLLKERTGRAGSTEPFKQVSLTDYAQSIRDIADSPRRDGSVPRTASGAGRIAIVYAEGEIVDGEGEAGNIGSTKFSRELRKLRQDDRVKAVVLRVNSPGGSASASEIIQREIRLIKEVKPIVISMGSYAASGGYWISAYGNRIFAEPTTITGSIGVFGLQFDVQQLASNVGITFDSVTTSRFADALTVSRPKTPEEMAVLQRMVDWIYAEFITKVAEGRNLTREAVEEIAQGRVWSGTEALKIGLVDEIGGLDDAIAFAATQAGLGEDYRLVEYPRQLELIEAVQEYFDQSTPEFARSQGLAGQIARRLESDLKMFRAFNDPKGVYARMPINLSIK